MNEIAVSVCCTVYNHEKYLRQCLDGFVKQKTNFKFEVIVHDDASTDGSADIIREYAKNYPEIFVPIYQTENQYSQNISITKKYIYPIMRGKYIASCEGDDYWCDENKLQRQYDFLRNNPEYSACVHNTLIYDCRTGEEHIKIENAVDQVLDTELVLERSVKEFHTSSVMYRREYLEIPEELTLSYCGDFPRALWLAINGKIFRFSDVMSVYRFFSEGSYTERTNDADNTVLINRFRESIGFFENFDRYNDYRFHNYCRSNIEAHQYKILLLQGKNKEAIRECPNYIKGMGKKDKLRAYMDAYLPFLSGIYRRIRDARISNKR